MDRLNPILARAFPWAAAISLASPFVLPATLNPGIVTVAGLLLGAVFVLAGTITSPRRFSGPVAAGALSVFAAVAWFALTSAMSASPVMSLVGIAGQHNGTALFALGAVWFLAGTVSADTRTLRTTLAVVTLSGAAYTAAALWETVQLGAQRDQGAAAGVFENSTSLGEVLAVAVVAALVWGLISRNSTPRWTAWVLGIVSLIGMVFAGSRTGFLGLVAAALYAAAIVWLPRFKDRATTLAALFPAGAIAVTAALVAASTGALGAAARSAVIALGTDRDVIWRSALAQFRQSPLFGSGLEQFSAWIRWSVAGGTFDAQVTHDPHSIVIASALGGGIIGVLLAATAIAALLRALTAAAEDAGASWPVSLLASVPVAALGCGLVGWISPAAMLATCAITGATLGSVAARSQARESASAYVPYAATAPCALGVFALVLALYSLSAIPAERAFAKISRDVTNPSAGVQSAALFEQWPDPAFATHSLGMLTPLVLGGDPQAARVVESVLSASEGDASWRADLAANQLLAVQALQAKGPAAFERFADIAALGLQAEPVSGLWDTLTAKQARLLGLSEQARVYAKRALTFPLEEETRASMEELASQ